MGNVLTTLFINTTLSDIMGEAAETDVEVEVAVQCKWISCKVAKSANLGERRTFTWNRERHSFPRFCSGFIGQRQRNEESKMDHSDTP